MPKKRFLERPLPGAPLVVVGPSGSGKTALLRAWAKAVEEARDPPPFELSGHAASLTPY